MKMVMYIFNPQSKITLNRSCIQGYWFGSRSWNRNWCYGENWGNSGWCVSRNWSRNDVHTRIRR